MGVTDVIAKLENALAELVTLKITTKVGDKVIQTMIDLVQGDITMTIDPCFNEVAQKPLLDLHLEREKQGADIIRQNIVALARLTKLLPDIKKALM